MTKYRMIAIDLDGTLLSSLGQVSPRVRSAVHSAMAAGVVICFATGRNLTESRWILDAVGYHGPGVFVGGAMVMDPAANVTLQRTIMAPALAAEVCGAMEKLGHAVLALQDREAVLNAATERWMAATRSTLSRVASLGDYKHQYTLRVGIVAEPPQIIEVSDMLRQRFARRIVSHYLTVPSTGVEVLEIFDPQVSKWQGVLRVAQSHGIGPEQIVAVGDDVNDLAMGNARRELREAARRVIGTNDEDGLALLLEELVAKEGAAPPE